ncbi:hypothetical protein EDD29_3374 [Actinocorallia herbida]|uniref:Uncharacterized protein n=1 Tax=Actinocorallia herbida TaxID=58109 RepID=A0A3N1CX64_9ACTN|nr:hypothetical protein [Actinocorallia herbida]ROO85825.1 hypothetical protein EDD29_3374 [Actinocorallia herbida]
MAVTSSEQRARDETRLAILKAIKGRAEYISRKQAESSTAQLRDLAEAYAVITGTAQDHA